MRSDGDGVPDGRGRRLGSRLLWFIGLYAAGVGVTTLVALAIKLALPAMP